MLRTFGIFAMVILPLSGAAGKDITITFNDDEQNALVQILDAATKAGGLQAAQTTIYFLNKLKAAQAPQPPSKPEK